MRTAAGFLMLAGLIALDGCESLRAEPAVPAVIVESSAESRAELQRVISSALNGAPITIAADALTRESVLILEHARPRDASGALLNGRERRRPEQFQLLKKDSECVLLHQRTGKRWTLSKTRCSAAES